MQRCRRNLQGDGGNVKVIDKKVIRWKQLISITKKRVIGHNIPMTKISSHRVIGGFGAGVNYVLRGYGTVPGRMKQLVFTLQYRASIVERSTGRGGDDVLSIIRGTCNVVI
jgi:hypothetical protein